MKTRATRSLMDIPRAALRMLRRWKLGVSSSGDLWIEPVGPALRLVELGELVRQLRPHCQDGLPKRMVFQLSGFPVIGTNPDTVERAVRQFAHDLNIECVVR